MFVCLISLVFIPSKYYGSFTIWNLWAWLECQQWQIILIKTTRHYLLYNSMYLYKTRHYLLYNSMYLYNAVSVSLNGYLFLTLFRRGFCGKVLTVICCLPCLHYSAIFHGNSEANSKKSWRIVSSVLHA